MLTRRLLVTTAALLALAAPALASFTKVGAPTKDQLSQEQILESIYSVDLVASGRNFTSSTIQVTRLEDFSLVSPQGLSGSARTAGDQLWAHGTYVATVKARFAPIPGTVDFGYFTGSAGGSYQKLFDVTGHGLDVTGSIGPVDALGQTWRWGEGRAGPAGANNYSSLQTDNAGKDYMVAYHITGLADEQQWTTWLLFWENTYGGSDRDFNDLVVEVKAVAMPAPGAIVMAIVGLCLVGYYQRRRITGPSSE